MSNKITPNLEDRVYDDGATNGLQDENSMSENSKRELVVGNDMESFERTGPPVIDDGSHKVERNSQEDVARNLNESQTSKKQGSGSQSFLPPISQAVKSTVKNDPNTINIQKNDRKVDKNKQSGLTNSISEADVLEQMNHKIKRISQFGGLSLDNLSDLNQEFKSCTIQTIKDNVKLMQELDNLNQMNLFEAEKEDLEDSSDSEDLFEYQNLTEEFNPGAANQSKNKSIFRQKFGVEKKIPSYYLLDAKICPKNVNYVLQVVKYAIPDEDDDVRSFLLENNGQSFVSSMKQVFSEREIYHQDSICLQLLHKQNGLEINKEIVIPNAKNVKIAFSRNGKYFALFRTKLSTLQVYIVEETEETDCDIEELMVKIQNNEYYKEFKDWKGLHRTKELYFDVNSRYLATYGKDLVNFINLEQDEEIACKAINKKKFAKILDINLVSNEDGTYRCDVACLQKDALNQKVVIFQINKDQEINLQRSIQFDSLSNQHKIIVKISDDFEKVVLSNYGENYILTRNEDDGDSYTQKQLFWLKNRIIQKVLPTKNDFLFISSREYDNDMDINHSNDPDFQMRIKKKIEPGSLNVLDCYQMGQDDQGYGNQMIIINTRGEDFFYDVVNPQIESNKQQEETCISDDGERSFIQSLIFNPNRGYRVCWPYAAFSGIEGFLWIYCAFDQSSIKRVQIPKDKGFVAHTFITKDYNIYVALQSDVNKKYTIFRLDLDHPKGFAKFNDQILKFEEILEIDFGNVDNKPMKDLFFRSQSRSADAHDELFGFFLHGEYLYQWQKGQNKVNKLSHVQMENLIQIDSDQFAYQLHMTHEHNKKQEVFKLMKVKIYFSTFSVSPIHEELLNPGENVKAMAYDSEKEVIFLMSRVKTENYSKYKKIKIFDCKNKELLSIVTVKDPEIIGRFKSGLFHLINGHFYFGNSVLKVRYDLMKNQKTKEFDESQIFDKYQNLLNLDRGEQIQAENPIVSLHCRRMGYFTMNSKKLDPKTLVILPYLHERKVYMQESDSNCEYFYTVMNEKIDMDHLLCIENVVGFLTKEKIKSIMRLQEVTQEMIVVMNITQYKYSVYTETGILLKRVSFKEQVEEYGVPNEVSSNGRFFLFQKPNNPGVVHILVLCFDEMIHLKTIDVSADIQNYIKQVLLEGNSKVHQQYLDFNQDYGAHFIKNNGVYKYNINDSLDVSVQILSKNEVYLRKRISQTFDPEDLQIIEQIFIHDDDQQMTKGLLANTMIKGIKNKLEEAVLSKKAMIENLKRQLSKDAQLKFKNMESNLKWRLKDALNKYKGSIFYIQKFSFGVSQVQLRRKNSFSNLELDKKTEKQDLQGLILMRQHKDFFVEDHQQGSFIMNSRYLFIWNNHEVIYMQHDNLKGHTSKLQKLDLIVDPKQKLSKIMLVRVGSNPNIVAIRVQQSLHLQCVVVWDMEKDTEKNSFDTCNDNKIFFDKLGDCYITEKDYVIFCKQNLKLKAFDVDHVNQWKYQHMNSAFGYNRGHRVDYKNHNWMLLDEYISLSFSFMTLVIRDKTQRDEKQFDDEEFVFDPEEYNFIINRRTFLTCDKFVGEDYEKLLFVLKQFKQVDPILLEQINYYYYRYDEEQLLSHSITRKDSKLGLSDFGIKYGKGKSKFVSMSLKGSALNQFYSKQVKGLIKETAQKIVSPLHIALEQGNNRSINILLQFMSQVESDNSDTIKDILYHLVDYQNFILYMDSLPFQTQQMQNKQTLKFEKKFNDEIVSIMKSTTSFVDDAYYRKSGEIQNEDLEHGEKSKLKNYPVKIWAFKVDWILQEKDGKKLMENILVSENQDIYKCMSIKSIIEFQYNLFKNKMVRQYFPIQVLMVITFYLTMWIGEALRPEDNDEAQKDNSFFFILGITIVSFNLVLTFIQLVIVSQRLCLSRKTYLRTPWAYIDMIYIVLNTLITIFILDDRMIDYHHVRQMQSILSILIILKLVYFMQLIDEIAPLVNIIIKIFKEIYYFCMILFVIIIAFSHAFQQIGRNQADRVNKMKKEYLLKQGLTELESDNSDFEVPTYHTVLGSFQHVMLLTLGEFELGYEAGENVYDTVILWALFWSATFLLLIHLLNMLIAIMGETFSNDNSMKDILMCKSHLQFVQDNKWLNALVDKEDIIYLITGFLSEKDQEEVEILHELKTHLFDIKMSFQKDIKEVARSVQDLKLQLLSNKN